jgi:hypothetical protein
VSADSAEASAGEFQSFLPQCGQMPRLPKVEPDICEPAGVGAVRLDASVHPKAPAESPSSVPEANPSTKIFAASRATVSADDVPSAGNYRTFPRAALKGRALRG